MPTRLLFGYDGSPAASAARTLLAATVQEGEAADEAAGPLPVGDRVAERLWVPGDHTRHGLHGRSVAAALAGCARRGGAAVLVVGSRGRSAVREMLFGSVAMAALHHGHQPVLVVHPAVSPDRPELAASTAASPFTAP
ncbi:universal stress protein [Dactylosporangium aurantiacum]|uniref:Universal stress protein n=1 Tax=Dactylosporangium aurantiacum TaxID=35754 RepID=A0A9Q9MI77_9ACTN|nr:universal stress protein [Dactylosporangium aurantiacum]MDG6106926.1 universal stress protein [Dactylosporangium aurantiacum]UWZ50712.1 universal stress protein [Dactylosporangium aurantiacum]